MNTSVSGLKIFKNKKVLILLFVMIIASASIMVVNFYTIRTLSGARAYINGESQYSKAEKSASAYLINYISFENESDYEAFQDKIKIVNGDKLARIEMSSANGNMAIAKKGLIAGKNDIEDIDDMIWLFKTFRHITLFEKAITAWIDADTMIDKLNYFGTIAHEKVSKNEFTAEQKRSMIMQVSKHSIILSTKGLLFADTLGEISRKINFYAFIINVFITLIIVFSSLAAAAIMMRNQANSKKKIIEQYENLQVINAGLDKFIYNITHDLRSPLASLIGLIGLIDDETDLDQIKAYTLMMKDSLEKQDRFINEMLTFIKSKHTGINKTDCSIAAIVDSVIAQNNYHTGGKQVQFYKEIELDEIKTDALKLNVVLNNLVSNSIKYGDQNKPEQWVRLRGYLDNDSVVIEVEDNGMGIRVKDQERIFDKFYMSGDNKHSSGIGLYLVKDAITQLNGTIEVESELGIGTKFKIRILFEKGQLVELDEV